MTGKKNFGIIFVFVMLLFASVVHATTIKIGFDGTNTCFTVPTSATKAEQGSLFFNTSTGEFVIYNNSVWLPLNVAGGVDDDVPESGDFGNAADLNADGSITDGVIDEADLDCDNAPVDEYVLTYEAGTGNFAWQVQTGGGSGSGDWETTKIMTSNGDNYTASEANLQAAIDSLDNTTGWVDGGNNSITLTSTLYVGTGCTLRNVKLTLGNAANCTMIRNYDITNGNDNITIHDVILEGNSGGQDVWYDAFYSYVCGIYLISCDYANIYNVRVNDTQSQGIFIKYGHHINVHDCFFTNIGSSFDGSGLAHYCACGVWYWGTNDSTISGCHVDNAFSEGYVFDGNDVRPNNCTIIGCSSTNTGFGIFFESADYINVIGCTLSCGSDDAWSGVNKARCLNFPNDCPTHIMVTGCILRDTFRAVGINSGKYISISDTTITNVTNYAVNDAGDYNSFIGNTIADIGSIGMVLAGSNTTVALNTITRCGQWSYGMSIASADRALIIGNRIFGTGNTFPERGIYGNNADTNCAIVYNQMWGCNPAHYISSCNARVNCTGFDDWNFYPGVS